MTRQPTITTQRTSKPIKLTLAVSVLMMLGGCPMMAMAEIDSGWDTAGAAVFVLGMAGFVGAKVAKWWYHE